MDLYTNLIKQTNSPSHRSIKQGETLHIYAPDTKNGYLIAALYSMNSKVGSLLQVRVDGMPGNITITPQNPTGMDTQDGEIDFPLYHKINDSITNFPIGTYFLKVEMSKSKGSVPEFRNIQFDIIL